MGWVVGQAVAAGTDRHVSEEGEPQQLDVGAVLAPLVEPHHPVHPQLHHTQQALHHTRCSSTILHDVHHMHVQTFSISLEAANFVAGHSKSRHANPLIKGATSDVTAFMKPTADHGILCVKMYTFSSSIHTNGSTKGSQQEYALYIGHGLQAVGRQE